MNAVFTDKCGTELRQDGTRFENARGDLSERTRKFALDVIQFTESLPRDETTRILARQLLRAGTSVGGNYRSAHRARSSADFIAKMGLVEEEADECGYWLELLIASRKVPSTIAAPLLKESNELVAIAVASIHTARSKPPRTTRK